MHNANATVICDLQFGSTGKGLIAGYIAKKKAPDVVVSAWMPNAGHTFIDSNGRKFVHTMIPNGIVSPKLKYILIGPGSMINPDSMLEEIKANVDLIADRGVKIIIHPNAGVVTKEHREIEETCMTSIGSTRKGCGQAIIAKIRRNPNNISVASAKLVGTDLHKYIGTINSYNNIIDTSTNILVEGAQGFSLSIHHGFYPYCTSRDVTTAQIMADCAIPFNKVKNVIGCARTYPIRVANRFDENGDQIGWSGPCYDDQKEIKWSDIGLEPELTTVTKLPRRIFTFSIDQIADAVRMCGVDEVFLNFANYCDDVGELHNIVESIDNLNPVNKLVKYVGWGSNINEIEQLR